MMLTSFFRRVISLPFVAVRYIRMAWGGLVANMPNGQAYEDFVRSKRPSRKRKEERTNLMQEIIP